MKDKFLDNAIHMGDKAKFIFHKGYNHVQRRLEIAGNHRVSLGISGLSRSGKSTFITSLINQLMNFENAKLSGFSPYVDNRIISVKIKPIEGMKLFPYEDFYHSIASDSPQWPNPTIAVSGCVLEIKMRHQRKSFYPLSNDEFTLKLEIRDYPGEWLLDLPLLDMTYQDWCKQCSAQYTTEPRHELLGELFNDLKALNPLSKVNEQDLIQLNKRYKSFLKKCKSHSNSLSFIQPGRFLVPGSLHDPLALLFIPLLDIRQYNSESLEKARPDSYYKINEDYYNRYIRSFVKPFFKDFFSTIDRQLILVDVIQALHAGSNYVDDLQESMNRMSKCFSYGNESMIQRLFSPKVNKVMYAATKVDQVHTGDHEAVKQLLGAVVRKSYQDIRHSGAEIAIEATSAVRSTMEYCAKGEEWLKGNVDGKMIGYINASIPDKIPENTDDWERLQAFTLPELLPPLGLSYRNCDVMPHIRMDHVIQHLIGDKCQ